MTTVQSARADWEEGHRRFVAEAADRARSEALHQQVDAVLDELRRRVGGTFTLAELTDAYRTSERWAREAVSERAPVRGWPVTLSLAVDEAFHRTSRAAADFVP